jgi:hypothetical protein
MAKIKNPIVLKRIDSFLNAGYKNVIYKNKKIYAFEKQYVIIDDLENSPFIYFLTKF